MNSQGLESITSFDSIEDGGAREEHHGNNSVGDIEAATPSAQVNLEQHQAMTGNDGMNYQLRRRRLYQAAIEGDWETANSIKDEHPRALTEIINDRGETVLHIATRVMKVAFIKKLVEFLTENGDDLALKNRYGNTALCIAAASGVVDIAEIMVDKNQNLTRICGSGHATPLLIATNYRHKNMVSYLLPKTPLKDLKLEERMEFLVCAISSNYYDLVLPILEGNKSLALEPNSKGYKLLHIMAQKSGAIGRKDKPTMWESCFKCKCKKTMMHMKARQLVKLMWKEVLLHVENVLDFINEPSSMLHDAAKVGNVEFLRVLIHSYPDLAWKVDAEGQSIFHIAVETRQKSVFNLIYEKGEFLDYLPTNFDEENTSLHTLAAKKPNQSHLNRVLGAAFQMHSELLWFKEVEKIEKLTVRTKTSMRELFTEEHKELVEEGEKWMKATANSCMLVATLIATVVFAAGFTLPGGVNNDTGSPLFLQRKLFAVFVISDAIALISSSTSILVFLSILTSRCAEDDFLFWLPFKLVLGLATLFLSVMTMVMAFSASFFLSYGKGADWVPWMIAGMAIVPVYCFFLLQFNIWADTMAALQATWRSNFLSRNGKTKVCWISNIIAPLEKFYEKKMCCKQAMVNDSSTQQPYSAPVVCNYICSKISK